MMSFSIVTLIFFLMKAEAKNGLGQDPSADINKVRQRAYGDKLCST